MIAPTTSSGPFQNETDLLLCPPPLPSPSRRPRRCFCRRAEATAATAVVPKTAFVVGRAAAAALIIAREQYVVVARSKH